MNARIARASSSLTEQAYQDLRADLLACRIAPGERLKISDMAVQRGVSLGAIREALARLSSDGLVINEPQRGFRAAPLSADQLRDLTEVRVHIEGMCLRRAIEIGDVAWESRLVAAFHRLVRTAKREPADPRRMNDLWSAVHEEFHEALVSACDSPTLNQIRRQLYAQSERYRRLSLPLAEFDRDLDGEHRAMLDAALGKRADEAVRLMSEHLEETTAILLSAGSSLASQQAPDPT
ncbi:GntR family transcriptional regulator [Pseudoxanthomonas sp. JBR18]|uniref:GntR family transcriptional regulator n=1 Tax=Pseudoxanthomonas sp. JBR18 TaxID=2969308 RepID=UPI00230530A1|nr:GntR family transcriptional regulator [Pseudoxanthomonas sp. JBR18]WCE06230.1 GntR family transcriptional regulator [Pseudoxanthomonas sp. JBR18]